MIFDYIIFFGLLALTIILGTIYYNVYIFTPKSQKLRLIGDFRYIRKLNRDLIQSLKNYSLEHKAFDKVCINDLTYNAAIDKLENWRDEVYTDNTFNFLKTTKPNKAGFNNLSRDLQEQIRIQNEIKACYNKILIHRSSFHNN